MYSCPDCGEELSSELNGSGTTYRHYCYNQKCSVIEVLSNWNHKGFREIKREAVPRATPLVDLSYEELEKNPEILEIEENE